MARTVAERALGMRRRMFAGLFLCTMAGTAFGGDEPDPRIVGPWGLHRFLDPYGFSMWIGFAPGSKSTLEVTRTILGQTAKDHIHLMKVLRFRPEQVVLQMNKRHFGKQGRLGPWSKSTKYDIPLGKFSWQIDKVTSRSHITQLGAIKSEQLHVTVKGADGQSRSVWKIVATKEDGILEAVRVKPPGVTWRLLNLGVEYTLRRKKLSCRSYKLLHDPPKHALGHIKEKLLLLCKDVPGYVVQASYDTGIGCYVERLVSFKGKRAKLRK